MSINKGWFNLLYHSTAQHSTIEPLKSCRFIFVGMKIYPNILKWTDYKIALQISIYVNIKKSLEKNTPKSLKIIFKFCFNR